jgi:hypothetical protein
MHRRVFCLVLDAFIRSILMTIYKGATYIAVYPFNAAWLFLA